MNAKIPFFDAARMALLQHYPGYQCAFVGGSMLRGQQTDKSDIDIVVLFGGDFDQPQRFSVVENGWPIEFFVQNIQAQDYFFDQDRRRGACILMNMVLNGIVLPEETAFSNKRKEEARRIIEEGPPALTREDIEDRLYGLTDLLDDLDPGRPRLEIYGVLTKLYNDLGDFHLRANNKWSGHGKALGQILRMNYPDMAHHYEEAFGDAFNGDHEKLIGLAGEIMQGFGGRYWAGHKRMASKDWKSFQKGALS